jgi:hypothetical protein
MKAAPILLRRLLQEKHERYDWQVDPKHTMKVWGLAKLRSRLSDYIEHLRNKPACHGAMILLDLEDQLPCEEAPALAKEIAALQPLPFPVVVVFACREFESWFLASLESIANGSELFPDGLTYLNDPEAKRGAKEEMDKQMPPLVKYKEVLHQAEFIKLLSFEEARRAPSFQRLERALAELLTAVDTDGGAGVISPRKR